MGFCALSCFFEAALSQSPVGPLAKFRQQHRKTIDGRLCAAAFVFDQQAYTDCAPTNSPDGASGREWCYVEEQAAKAGARSWVYCAAKVDYAGLRTRLDHAFEEKASELADTVSVLTGLSSEAMQLLDTIAVSCA